MSGGNMQKAVQFMMAKGCVKSDEFEALLDQLRPDNSSQLSEEKILHAVQHINGKITKYNMMLRATVDEKTLEKYYVLISTVDNDITRTATHHNPKELEYFRLIYSNLRDGPAEESTIVRLADRAKLTQTEGRALIKQWVAKHWIASEDRSLRLGPRSKAELDVLEAGPS